MASGIETKLDEIEESYEQAAAELAAPDIAADPHRLRDLGKRFAELQDVVTQRAPGRETAGETTLYKSVGTALQDVAVAFRAYQQAELAKWGDVVRVAKVKVDG